MQADAWFAIPQQLHVEALAFESGGVTILASTQGDTSRCPECRYPSRRLHSRYRRTIADLPWGGVPMRLCVTVRKLFCDNISCSRKVFAERMEEFAQRYARRTERQREALEDIGFALGGRAGARLAAGLGLRASRDTLLRLVRSLHLHIDYTPRVLGVDDWSLRKAQTYGTILVDLERRRVVDLLPDRSAETLAEWLLRHRGVEVVTRDRSGAYADGIARGAPGAVQVADRWHLARNLGDALEEMLSRNRSCLKDVCSALSKGIDSSRDPPSGYWDPASGASPLAKSRSQQEAQCARREDRVGRYRRLMELREQGVTIKEAAKLVGIGKRTANRWIAAGGYPERRVRRRTHGELDGHVGYIRERWGEGCRNRTQIWREICERGYSGPKHPIYRYVKRLEAGLLVTTRDMAAPSFSPDGARAPSPRRAAWLLLRDQEDLDEGERDLLRKLLTASDDASAAYPLVRDFLRMLRERKGEEFHGWLNRAEGSGVREIENFAAGLRRDEAAVRAGLTLPYSNGQTEGQVNRLKLIKRQGYGRANLDLLRQRVLRAA